MRLRPCLRLRTETQSRHLLQVLLRAVGLVIVPAHNAVLQAFVGKVEAEAEAATRDDSEGV